MGEIRNLAQLLDVLKRGGIVKDSEVVFPDKPQAAHKLEKAERHFCISIGGHTIGIHTRYGEVYDLCRNYLCEDNPEIQIQIEESDLAAEREVAGNSGSSYRDSYLETLTVYRKICEEMLRYDTFLMHGAVIATGNNSYMFTAKSGTGKTTHIRKWLDRLEDAYVVNGDKPLIRITDTMAIACGTPWCGKEQLETNSMVPLQAIVMMERGENNEINEVSFGEAFSFLLQQTYHPNDTERMKKTLHLISLLSGKVRFFRFVFNNLKSDAFDVAYQALTEDKV